MIYEISYMGMMMNKRNLNILLSLLGYRKKLKNAGGSEEQIAINETEKTRAPMMKSAWKINQLEYNKTNEELGLLKQYFNPAQLEEMLGRGKRFVAALLGGAFAIGGLISGSIFGFSNSKRISNLEAAYQDETLRHSQMLHVVDAIANKTNENTEHIKNLENSMVTLATSLEKSWSVERLAMAYDYLHELNNIREREMNRIFRIIDMASQNKLAFAT